MAANGQGGGDICVRRGVVLAPVVHPTRRLQAVVGLEARTWEERLGPRPPLGRTPQRGPVAVPVPLVRRRQEHLHGPPGAHQLVEPLQPVRLRAMDQGRQQQVVKLVRATQARRHLGPHFFQCGGVKARQIPRLNGQAPAQLHLAGAPLLQRGVVEVRVRLPVDYFVREHGGLHRVHEMGPDGARVQAGDEVLQPVYVHGLVEAIVEHLANYHVVRQLYGAGGRVLLAGGQSWEYRRHEVVRLHALDGQGIFLASPEAQDGQ